MPRGKQGMKAARKEINRAFQDRLRERKRQRAERRAEREARAVVENAPNPGGIAGAVLDGSYDSALMGEPVAIPANPAAPGLILGSTATTEPSFAPPYRAADKKIAGQGWLIVDAEGQPVEYGSSRDKARARAKELNVVDPVAP